ncbi:MAG: hydrogenase expression/formation protein HypE [Pseudomonadota bacterium]
MDKPIRDQYVTLAHGSGGKAMRDLVRRLMAGTFDNPLLAPLEDQARIDVGEELKPGDRLAYTTDSFVVDPIFFPGSDIGELAVNGTVNDLAVGGARPLYLSCGLIIEEGLAIDDLTRILKSMKAAADTAGVAIVTGDTKVVHRGKGDKIFINTSGIGVIPAGLDLSPEHIRPGDRIIVNGTLGDHGVAILAARGELAIESPVQSDCQPLHGLVAAMLAHPGAVRCLRDATRGGLATVLNEFAETAGHTLYLDEAAIPVRDDVRGMTEILGLDPLYLANEGKLVAVVVGELADRVLEAMRAHPAGANATLIGEVTTADRGRVIMRTAFGGERIVDLLVSDPLPRIC